MAIAGRCWKGCPLRARLLVIHPARRVSTWKAARSMLSTGRATSRWPVRFKAQNRRIPRLRRRSSVRCWLLIFRRRWKRTPTGFVITLADHYALKSGTTLTVTNAAGESTKIRLVVDFVDYLPDPRPTFAENVRHSHPYGIVANRTNLYVVDAGFNNVRKVEIATGAEQILVSFPTTPSPLTNGPPAIENVPTSIHWLNGQLLVTTLGGAPFLPGYSKVLQINPQTGAVVSLVEGLTAAIDSTPLASNRLSAGLLTLEYNLSFPRPGPGRLQSFTVPTSVSVTNSGCLETPVSMLIDATAGRLIVAELNTGRLVWLPVPQSMPRPGSIYFSEFAGGRICRANLDGSGKVTLASGLSLPIGPSLDFVRGQMYWGETGAATMRRANLDGTRQTAIVNNPNGGMPTLDLVTGRMYWNVSSSGTLQSANLDGSDRQVLVTGQNDPHTVELDLANGRIYWPEYGAGNIRRANLDGTGMTNLLRGLASPALMTLDVAGGKMYWTAHGTDDIRRANLDGSGQEILVRSQSDPAGIALDVSSGHIYWADSGTGQIRRANLDGTGQEIVIRGLEGPAFVTLDLSALPPPERSNTSQAGRHIHFDVGRIDGTRLSSAIQVRPGPDELGQSRQPRHSNQHYHDSRRLIGYRSASLLSRSTLAVSYVDPRHSRHRLRTSKRFNKFSRRIPAPPSSLL